MASNKTRQERVKALVAELLAEESAEGWCLDAENINDIEDGMVRIGDLVAQEFGQAKLARHMHDRPVDPQCPDCGHQGEQVGEQTRDLITRRGRVPLTEAKYRCPKCRRLFSPSDDKTGAGSHLRLHAADVSADRVRRDARDEL